MLASCHDPGEPIKASTVTAMSSAGVPAMRVLDVLTAAGEGIVLQDRPDSLTGWIDAQFKPPTSVSTSPTRPHPAGSPPKHCG